LVLSVELSSKVKIYGTGYAVLFQTLSLGVNFVLQSSSLHKSRNVWPKSVCTSLYSVCTVIWAVYLIKTSI